MRSEDIKKFNLEMTDFINALYDDGGKVLVYGDGRVQAKIMLIGEAPGEHETIQGRPFVGKAGKNLDRFLDVTGFNRADLYITNAVKFRPVKISKAGRTVNRTPSREEVELFLPWLKREIEIVNPQCVVTLGNTSLRALTYGKQVIGAVHGQCLPLGDKTLFPIYHPASLIYNRALSDTYEKDLMKLASIFS